MLFTGANPGFYVSGEEIQQGVWRPFKVLSGSRAEPYSGDGRGFEHLNSVSVNDFETFCGVFKCI